MSVDDYPDLMARLDAVERELLALPADDFPGKHRLLTERDALRRLIQELQGDRVLTDDRPTPEIEREIAALRASAEAVRKQRIDLVKQAGGGRTNEMGNQGGMQINRMIDAANGYAAIQQRIGQLETILEHRAT